MRALLLPPSKISETDIFWHCGTAASLDSFMVSGQTYSDIHPNHGKHNHHVRKAPELKVTPAGYTLWFWANPELGQVDASS